MRHRRDIDGLRAVAVIPVVLFHAGATRFSGGFVGVDIFFVISGYLITALIVGEMQEQRFSLVTFYERRMRRIFPALFAVLAASTVLALILFMPWDLIDFGRSLVATALFVSNIHFYGDSGYFDAPLNTKPLLHTWSLAVEEQFYIVFPLILMIAFRWGGRRWIALIFALFVASLAASIWLTPVNPDAAFYLAPTRVWELMLGALLAAGLLPTIRSQRLREIAALTGIALIAYAVFRFSWSTPFPGSAALIPCLGAALVIYAGEHGGASIVSRALSLWPLVFVGLISYSLYLWHWPLLVFARYWNIAELTTLQAGAIVVASFSLAALSWAYIEQPFRRKPAPIPRSVLFAGAATVLAVVLSFGAFDSWTGGFSGRFSPEVLAATTATKPLFSGRTACGKRPTKEPCIFGAAVQPSYALWGDSHARIVARALGATAARYHKAVRVFIHTTCPPVLGIDIFASKKSFACSAENAATMHTLESSPDIGTVILVSRYAAYIDGPTRYEASMFKRPSFITDESGAELDLEGRRALFERQFDLTIDRLLAAGKTVVLVYPVPEADFSVPAVIGSLLARGGDPASLGVPHADFQSRQDIIFPILDGVGQSQRILRVYPHRKLCDAVRCVVYANGAALYRDDDHLSSAGVEFLRAEFEPIFQADGKTRTAADLIGP